MYLLLCNFILYTHTRADDHIFFSKKKKLDIFAFGVLLWCMLAKVKASWTYDYLEETNIDPEIPDSFRYGMIKKRLALYS